MACTFKSVSISDIKVGERARKDIGDVSDLAESIKAVGLLHPIGVDSKLRLCFGGRRLEALKMNGYSHATVAVCRNADDVLSALRMERDENTCRKPLAPSEAVALGKQIEEMERPKAEEREKAGKEPSSNLDEGGRTDEKAAEAVGMGRMTYRKAKEVVEAAEADPELKPVVEEMDRTGKVDPAHKKVRQRKPKPKRHTVKADTIRDAIGQTVPDHLRDIFGDAWLTTLAEQAEGWIKELDAADVANSLKNKSQPYGAYLRAGKALEQLAAAIDELETFHSTLAAGIPHAVHADCEGKGCSKCRKTGWVPEWRHEELDHE